MEKSESVHTRILIIFIAGIGDVILFTPVLKALMRYYENCEISIVVPPDLYSCVRRMPYFSDVIVCETSNEHSFSKRALQLAILSFYVLRKKFDIVIAPLSVKCTTASLLARLSRAGKKIGYIEEFESCSPFFPFTEPIKKLPFEHDLLQNMKVLDRLHISSSDMKTEFNLSEGDRSEANAFLKDYGVSDSDILVAFHPATRNRKGYVKRNWPVEKYACLGQRISLEFGAKIILLGSSEQRKIAEDIKAFIGEDVIIQAGETSIHGAGAILERCKLLVCNDSALMHIAGALEIPMVAIWGPTKYVRRGYTGENQIIARKPFPCSPCQHEAMIFMKECDSRECLMQLTVEEVFESCRKLLASEKLHVEF